VVTVELVGLELHGRHGVLPEERERGQRFQFDVWLEARDPPADRIADAVDYRAVAACVRDVSDARAFQLLETLAAAVADELVARFPVERARVRVRKPDVRLDLPVEYSAVTVERERPS
jgi:dihydroneopterin aldolase